jgi:hypothetical protein
VSLLSVEPERFTVWRLSFTAADTKLWESATGGGRFTFD